MLEDRFESCYNNDNHDIQRTFSGMAEGKSDICNVVVVDLMDEVIGGVSLDTVQKDWQFCWTAVLVNAPTEVADMAMSDNKSFMIQCIVLIYDRW